MTEFRGHAPTQHIYDEAGNIVADIVYDRDPMQMHDPRRHPMAALPPGASNHSRPGGVLRDLVDKFLTEYPQPGSAVPKVWFELWLTRPVAKKEVVCS